MKKQGLLLAFGLACLAIGAQSHAAKYGMAGCGVGSLIFEDKPGKIQILAATTNDYFVQTFSITSGTSNCEDTPETTAALYMQINQAALQKDIARGSGETLAGLSKIYGCERPEAIGSALKDHYSTIYENNDPKAVSGKIESILRAEEGLRSSCKVFS